MSVRRMRMKFRKSLKILLLLSFCTQFPHLFAYNIDYMQTIINAEDNALKFIEELKGGARGKVSLVQDALGNKFCVKQYKIYDVDNEFGTVRAVLASIVAESLDIPINRVRIIPAHRAFAGKYFEGRVATLHTFVEGSLVKYLKLPYEVSIRLKYKEDMPTNKRGLTYPIIQSMSFHKDLPVIVAFDTFVSNSGRHRKNLFYNKQSDRFCGIDLEQAGRKPFDMNYSQISYYNMKELFQNSQFKLSNREKAALKLFHKTLKELIKKNPPEKFHTILDQLVDQTGFKKKGYFSSGQEIPCNVELYVKRYKIRISQQYASAQKLAAFLDKVL